MRHSPKSISVILAALALPCLAAPENLEDALRTGELICEFNAGYARVEVADLLRPRPPVKLMLFYTEIDPKRERAEVVSTRSAGRKAVVTRSTAQAVHLIETQTSSVMATTLTGCEDWRIKRGVQTCVRFAARHAWHFDASALADPDASFKRHARGAYTGYCEPWTLD